MIDSLLNLIFRCAHKRLTMPVTPVSKDGMTHGDTYVVCLDCGKQFSYDLKKMCVGKPLPTSSAEGVLPSGMPGPRTSKVKLAVVASALPLGIAIGSMLKSKREHTDEPPGPDEKDPANRNRPAK
jgi:hypothetical protein